MFYIFKTKNKKILTIPLFCITSLTDTTSFSTCKKLSFSSNVSAWHMKISVVLNLRKKIANFLTSFSTTSVIPIPDV